MKDKYHIGIIGPENVIGNFKALGLDIFSATKPNEAIEILKNIKKNTAEGQKSYAIIFVIDSLLENLTDEEKSKITTGSLPAILTIPSLDSTEGIGLEKLKKLAERAIGSDVGNI